MKKSLSVLVLFLAFMTLPVAARAQEKIGVLSLTPTIASTGEGKKAISDLEKKFAPRRQELQRMQQEIQEIQGKLSKQGATLSDDEQRRLARDLEDKQRVFKRSADDAQSDYNADSEDSVRRIGQKMVKVIADYATQNGFVLIIDATQIPIYYASKETDISAEIAKRYDAAYPLAGAAAPVAKPATTHP
jgi:outer membrane protein